MLLVTIIMTLSLGFPGRSGAGRATAVASPVQTSLLLLPDSLAAVCVQPNITWHAYDAAWSAQREGVNRQKSCLCNTAAQTTLLPSFFRHMATAAAVHLIHWLTVWGFPVLAADCKNECIMQRSIAFPYQNSTSATGAMKSFPGLVMLSSRHQHHACLEKNIQTIPSWVCHPLC